MEIYSREDLISDIKNYKIKNSKKFIDKYIVKIEIENSFKTFLDRIDNSFEIEEIKSDILKKVYNIITLSSELKNNKKPSTSNITSVYSDCRWDWLKKLKEEKNDNIKYFFENFDELWIDFSSLTWMMSQKSGIPDLEKVRNLISLLNEKNKNIEEKINFSSISSMYKWRWIPDLNILSEIIDFSTNEKINFSSISCMQRWKWAPDLEKLKILNNFLKEYLVDFKSISFCLTWKWIPKDFENFLQELKEIFDLVDKYIDFWVHIKSIMNMQAWLWLPNKEKLKEFLNFCISKKVKVSSICSMQSWKWIPNLDKLDEFIQISNWRIESICSMQERKWIPNLDKLKDFLKLVGSDNCLLREITWKQLWLDKSMNFF